MDTGGQRDGSPHVEEERQGQWVEGRQAHSQDLGSGPEEAARKGLLLAGSWRARTVRVANHTMYTLSNCLGICRIARPSTMAGPARGAAAPP